MGPAAGMGVRCFRGPRARCTAPAAGWSSRGKPDADHPKLEAKTEPGRATALAVSRGGTHVATAIGSTLRVSRTHARGEKASDPLALPGAGPVARDALAFVGSGGSRLVSASRDVLSLWDLDQRTRIARATEVVVPDSCLACEAPRVSVSPDGRDAAVLDSEGTRRSTLRLGVPATDEWQRNMPSSAKIPGFAELVWRPDSERLIVVAPDGSAEILARGRAWRSVGGWPALPNPLRLFDPPTLLRFLPGGARGGRLRAGLRRRRGRRQPESLPLCPYGDPPAGQRLPRRHDPERRRDTVGRRVGARRDRGDCPVGEGHPATKGRITLWPVRGAKELAGIVSAGHG